MDKEQAQQELLAILSQASDGTYHTMEEVRAHLAEGLAPENIVYMTGDTHGQFDRIIDFCAGREVEQQNTLIILGDVGLNYYGGKRDLQNKECLAQLPITFFCIHGNHEKRPSPDLGYELRDYHGGKVWVEPAFPNLLFAIDGEVYDFCGHACLVIGGAYSVDKHYRLSRGWSWWEDEQPSFEVKAKVEQVLSDREWKIDTVLSHTCPRRYEPTEVFLPMIDQGDVDKSTENWLGELESRLSYERWYCGHYHTQKKIDKIRFLFDDYALLPPLLSIAEEEVLVRHMEHQAEIVAASGLLAVDSKDSPQSDEL